MGPIAFSWRRGWDSNPRYGYTVLLISNQARSTTPAPLLSLINKDLESQFICEYLVGSATGSKYTALGIKTLVAMASTAVDYTDGKGAAIPRSEGRGHRFESCRARHSFQMLTSSGHVGLGTRKCAVSATEPILEHFNIGPNRSENSPKAGDSHFRSNVQSRSVQGGRSTITCFAVHHGHVRYRSQNAGDS